MGDFNVSFVGDGGGGCSPEGLGCTGVGFHACFVEEGILDTHLVDSPEGPGFHAGWV